MEANNWKTTKEVAEALGVATKTILNFRSNNPNIFQGLIKLPSEGSLSGRGATILWSDESVKILVRELSIVAKDWKDSIKDEFMEKGIVIAETDNLDIIESQAKVILNLIQVKKRQALAIGRNEKEIQAMQIELVDHSKIIEQHIDDLITDENIQKIRDQIQWIYDNYQKSVWNELHERFHFSKLARISEKKGNTIIEYLNIHYRIDEIIN